MCPNDKANVNGLHDEANGTYDDKRTSKPIESRCQFARRFARLPDRCAKISDRISRVFCARLKLFNVVRKASQNVRNVVAAVPLEKRRSHEQEVTSQLLVVHFVRLSNWHQSNDNKISHHWRERP